MNFSGHYELDKTRSESLYPHMRALGCDEIAALASEKLNITVDIVQNKSNIVFNQASQLGETKRILHLEGPTTDSAGRISQVILDPHAGSITISTQMKTGKIQDVRVMDGDTMIQTLVLTIKGTDQPIKTTRYLIRKGPPHF